MWRTVKEIVMSSDTHLLLIPVPESDPKYRFDEPGYQLRVDYLYEGGGHEVWIPRGFIYDGASIPAFAWNKISTPFNPRIMRAAVVHDWVYYNHQMDRDDADELFDHILDEDGFGSTTRWVVRQALALAGGFYWDNDDDDIAFLKHLWNDHPMDNSYKARFKFPKIA